MRFIAEDNPNLYIDVENYSELEEKIKNAEILIIIMKLFLNVLFKTPGLRE